jgi:predicted TIM-barrel fold metal-dependent hydrolase
MSYSIVDVHVHLGASAALTVAGGVDDLLRKMDTNGIDQAVLSPIPGQEDPDGVASIRQINNTIAAARSAHPDRFPAVLAAAEPRHGAPGLDEVDRVMGDLGFAGLGFHNDFQGYAADHPNMFALMDRLSAWPDPIVQTHTAIHSWLEAPFQVGKLARAYPLIRFINAHALMDQLQLTYTLDQAQALDNMYFDTCISVKQGFPIETVVAQLGDNRFLFGSDIPYFRDRCLDIDLIVDAAIPEQSKQRILGDNARRLFGF